MLTTDETVGLYVVGWYVCDAWRTPKVAGAVGRSSQAKSGTANRLEQQAAALSTASTMIEVILLDATLS